MKIVLNALPITAPPLAVFCWAAVTTPISWSIETPASDADWPVRLIAAARSSALTANSTSTAAILLITCVEVRPALLKVFIAAVRFLTESADFMPVNLVKIKASFVRFKVSSMLKPCLANSVAASATTSKV